MSYKTEHALVCDTRAGRNTNFLHRFDTSIEIGSAFMYSYCVKYLLTESF